MSFFYNRDDELKKLLALADGLPQGKVENLALIGVRKVGKTLILPSPVFRSKRRSSSAWPDMTVACHTWPKGKNCTSGGWRTSTR